MFRLSDEFLVFGELLDLFWNQIGSNLVLAPIWIGIGEGSPLLYNLTSIIMDNITVENTIIILNNIIVELNDCALSDTTISDAGSPVYGISSQLQITVKNCIIQCNNKSEVPLYVLLITSKVVVMINIIDTSATNCHINISTYIRQVFVGMCNAFPQKTKSAD